jgi:tetratricopeptide (TPR) repeat protein
MPARASILCKRAAYLHAGNALHAQGKYVEAREYYEKVIPLLESEPRSCRIDWERSSALINIGDTYSRENNFEKASEYYDKGEQFGKDHLDVEDGNHTEAKGIIMVAKKARAAALKRAGKDDEAKAVWRDVLTLSVEFKKLMALDKAEMKEALSNGGQLAVDEENPAVNGIESELGNST